MQVLENNRNQNQNQNQKYSHIFEWLRREVDQLDALKKDLIKDAADRLLAEGMKSELICSAICTELDGRVSERYVQLCLPKVFKQQQYVAQTPMTENENEDTEEIEMEGVGRMFPVSRNISPSLSDQQEVVQEEEPRQEEAEESGQWVTMDCQRFISTIWKHRDKTLWIKHEDGHVIDVWPTRR